MASDIIDKRIRLLHLVVKGMKKENMLNKVRNIGVSVLITISFVLVIGIISSIAMMTIEKALEHMALISGIAQTIYLLLALSILKISKIDIKNTIGLKLLTYKEYLLPGIAAFCFSAFSNIIQSVVPIPQELISGMSEDIEKSLIAFIFAIFFVAPVVEEFVFRGLIMTKLRKHNSAIFSIVISALLFALIHIMAGGIITMVHAFLGGLIFALGYEKTKSLFVAIVAHIFANIGGYVPNIISELSMVVQYIVAISFIIFAVIACIKMSEKINK